jgi:phosphoribosylformylglycinamidine synthase subunit PurS
MDDVLDGRSLFQVGVRVTLRAAVLDTQGQAILRGLHAMEFSAIEDVRAGKFFRLSVRAASTDEALATAARACERLLANPVIETFDLALDGDQ